MNPIWLRLSTAAAIALTAIGELASQEIRTRLDHALHQAKKAGTRSRRTAMARAGLGLAAHKPASQQPSNRFPVR